MPPHTLSALTLGSAMFFGVAAMAGDLPKEGTFSGAYTGWGTAKATQIGKERLLVSTDQSGVTLTNGFTDHVVWHCWGTNDAVKGMAQWSGYCTGTDPAGDQLVYNCVGEKHALEQKTSGGSCSFTTGTGKYVGVSGGLTYMTNDGELAPMGEGGTFAFSNPFKGNYKLP